MSSKSGAKWFKSAFGTDDSNSSNSNSMTSNTTRKTRSTTNDTDKKLPPKKSKKTPVPNDPLQVEAFNWMKVFTPHSVEDLAIHPKKLTELTEWLKLCETKKRLLPGPILLINGPSGCGKTVSLNTIAKSLGYHVSEWINPLDIDLMRNSEVDNDGNYYKESQVNLFRQFLFRASRYQSLFEQNEKRLILVKDLPNIFYKNTEAFEEVLERYTSLGKCPLVFIATDTQSKDLNISYKLFGDATRERHQVNVISFNSVAATLMKKALKRIVCLMTSEFSSHYNTPDGSLLESISVTSQGDLRNAVLSLHFSCLKGASGIIPMEVLSKKKKEKGAKTSKGSKSQTGTDETLTVMHALGRVFHPKYQPDAPEKLLYNPEDMADHFQSQPSTFVDLIYSNYVSHFTDIDDIVEAADCLSLCNILSNEWRDEDLSTLGMSVGIRGVMLHNSKTASGWIPVKRVNKVVLKPLDSKGFGIPATTAKTDVILDYLPYAKIIQSKKDTFKAPYPMH